MGESPRLPLADGGSKSTEPNHIQPPQGNANNVASAFRMYTAIGVAAAVVGGLTWTALIVHQLGVAISFGGSLITVLATAVIARFTITLSNSTEKLSQAGEEQGRVIAKQLEVMDAQKTAMEGIANAVGQSAEAAKTAALLIKDQLAMVRRQHVANNLPLITVVVTSIDYRDDTSLSLHFRVGNFGNTVATITGCVTIDGFHQGGPANPAVWGAPHADHSRVVGETLPHGELLPGVHACDKMNLAYHAVSMGRDFIAGTDLLFEVRISYDDEVGDHRGARIQLTYERNSQSFINHNT